MSEGIRVHGTQHCSWGLVKAYQETWQNVYICPPAPHVLEAYNHKVNHDTHKELNMQECAVLQYARALQYISYCNDARYKDKWAPVVKHFWAKVVEPFRSQTLHNLDPSHLLGTVMCPNQGAKIPDYGVHKHIAFICAPFFEGIESWFQYEKGDTNGRSTGTPRWLWVTTESPPTVPAKGPRSGMSKGLRWQDKEVDLIVNPGGGETQGRGRAIVQGEVDPSPQGTSLPMTCPAHRIKNCPHLLNPHGIKWWKRLTHQKLQPNRWPSEMP